MPHELKLPLGRGSTLLKLITSSGFNNTMEFVEWKNCHFSAVKICGNGVSGSEINMPTLTLSGNLSSVAPLSSVTNRAL